jgi:hypothetical protein
MTDNVIYSYTSEQAEEDGILFNITKLNPSWERGIFNFVTVNLLNQGYFEEDGKIRMVNLVDLLNQANEIVKKATKNFTKFDSFFSGNIELPSGKQQKIFIEQNETGKLTILLPEDH